MAVPSGRPRSLRSIRRELEKIDRQIVLLLAARVRTALDAIALRSQEGETVTNSAQEDQVLARARAWAAEVGLSPGLVESVLRSTIEEGKRRFSLAPAQSRGIRRLNADPSARPPKLSQPAFSEAEEPVAAAR